MAATPDRAGPRATPAGGTPAPGRPARAGRILPAAPPPVKPETAAPAAEAPRRGRPPERPRTRRQSHGPAWHWRQTDCWYYTLPGTKKRVALFDEDGARIRGGENKEQARLALARVKLAEGFSEAMAAQVLFRLRSPAAEPLAGPGRPFVPGLVGCRRTGGRVAS